MDIIYEYDYCCVVLELERGSSGVLEGDMAKQIVKLRFESYHANWLKAIADEVTTTQITDSKSPSRRQLKKEREKQRERENAIASKNRPSYHFAGTEDDEYQEESKNQNQNQVRKDDNDDDGGWRRLMQSNSKRWLRHKNFDSI